ncbi:MAG: hypothetical protein HYX73_04560 [Acidobacteria bacterium]|nr:hypothetical protein [Acidobacteriota bacterium]
MMHRVRTFIVTHLWWVVLIVAVVLLLAHSFSVQGIVVDTTSLVLLVLILISPFVAAIKKIKIGEFVAEIEPEEVKRVARQAEKSVPDRLSGDGHTPEISEPATAILTLAETDPVIALAKLRIELESRLRRLHLRIKQDVSTQKRLPPLTHVIRELAANEVFPSELGTALRDVIAICNRAIHGEDIRTVDARQITDVGIDLLGTLGDRLLDYAVTHPAETTTITLSERDEFQNARYRLTTVIPLVDKPKRQVYLLTQEELDAFFEGYSEFAEFAVALEKIS